MTAKPTTLATPAAMPAAPINGTHSSSSTEVADAAGRPDAGTCDDPAYHGWHLVNQQQQRHA